MLKHKKYNSASKALFNLHWLPIAYRIQYEIMMLIHKCLKGMAPKYLCDLLTINNSGRHLRNCNRRLIVPYVKNEAHVARSFSVIGPRIWNNLPESLRMELNMENF